MTQDQMKRGLKWSFNLCKKGVVKLEVGGGGVGEGRPQGRAADKAQPLLKVALQTIKYSFYRQMLLMQT